MSGNSCESAFVTAPMVSDLARATGSAPGAAAASPSAATSVAPSSGSAPSGSLVTATSAGEEGQLELADLQLVPVLEPVRVHALPVDVGAVERARVVEQPVPAAAHERRVLARDGDVVEEHVGLGRPPDRHPLAGERKGLADAPAPRADDQRAALGGDVADVDGLELARLVVDHVGRGRDVLLLRLWRPLEGAALRAVVRPLGNDEAALRTVAGHPSASPRAAGYALSSAPWRPARMSVRRWTSAPEMTSSPPSCFLRSRFTSSARRMSILPCRMRRR